MSKTFEHTIGHVRVAASVLKDESDDFSELVIGLTFNTNAAAAVSAVVAIDGVRVAASVLKDESVDSSE